MGDRLLIVAPTYEVAEHEARRRDLAPSEWWPVTSVEDARHRTMGQWGGTYAVVVPAGGHLKAPVGEMVDELLRRGCEPVPCCARSASRKGAPR